MARAADRRGPCRRAPGAWVPATGALLALATPFGHARGSCRPHRARSRFSNGALREEAGEKFAATSNRGQGDICHIKHERLRVGDPLESCPRTVIQRLRERPAGSRVRDRRRPDCPHQTRERPQCFGARTLFSAAREASTRRQDPRLLLLKVTARHSGAAFLSLPPLSFKATQTHGPQPWDPVLLGRHASSRVC